MADSDEQGSGFGRSLWIATGLLLAVPIAPVLKYVVGASPVWIFAAGAVAIAVLADWIRRATEQAAKSLGPAIGGLMTVSFGSIAEIVLAFFVLAAGKAEVVKAQITGSILGTSLLGLGLAIVVGTLGREQLRFKRERAGLLSSLLILAVIALLLPAVFDLSQRALAGAPRLVDEEDLSLGVAIVLVILYAANLAYTLVTHRDVFAPDEPRDTEGAWPMAVSIGVLIGATALVAIEAEAVSSALEATAASLGLSDVFVGVVVLALVGTASDLFAAAWFARRGKMGLALNICVGSSVQVALVVAPLLVIASWILGKPITLVFGNPLDLFAIAGTVFIVNAIASDGEATWFEGVLLIGVYVLLGMAFFFVSRPA
ncbi:MAG: calcium/proton exchanger [Pseudomonadota bacterium]|nr:calcium/proton exchanger [Pseudomonadota bacterium]